MHLITYQFIYRATYLRLYLFLMAVSALHCLQVSNPSVKTGWEPQKVFILVVRRGDLEKKLNYLKRMQISLHKGTCEEGNNKHPMMLNVEYRFHWMGLTFTQIKEISLWLIISCRHNLSGPFLHPEIVNHMWWDCPRCCRAPLWFGFILLKKSRLTQL